jgi:hypothetical protein
MQSSAALQLVHESPHPDLAGAALRPGDFTGSGESCPAIADHCVVAQRQIAVRAVHRLGLSGGTPVV